MYRLNKDGKQFTLFPLKNGSRPKVKHKVKMQNDVAVASGRHLNLLLMQKDEIVGVHRLQDRLSKFLERSCIWSFRQTQGRVFPKRRRLMRGFFGGLVLAKPHDHVLP